MEILLQSCCITEYSAIQLEDKVAKQLRWKCEAILVDRVIKVKRKAVGRTERYFKINFTSLLICKQLSRNGTS
nr:unnamed protein product [Haemonchus contortus]